VTVLSKASTCNYSLTVVLRDPTGHTVEHGFGSRNGSRDEASSVPYSTGWKGVSVPVHDQFRAPEPLRTLVASDVRPVGAHRSGSGTRAARSSGLQVPRACSSAFDTR
jgi:hypothetical protein